MGSAKWFMFILLAFTITSVMVGIADMQFLGPYGDQCPMFSVFKIFGITSSSEVGEVAVFGWKDIVGVIGLIPRALFWEYSVLIYSGIGNFVRWIILIPMSVGLLISFALMAWSHIPLIGRGSQ